jgi:hypothetical protein
MVYYVSRCSKINRPAEPASVSSLGAFRSDSICGRFSLSIQA